MSVNLCDHQPSCILKKVFGSVGCCIDWQVVCTTFWRITVASSSGSSSQLSTAW